MKLPGLCQGINCRYGAAKRLKPDRLQKIADLRMYGTMLVAYALGPLGIYSDNML